LDIDFLVGFCIIGIDMEARGVRFTKGRVDEFVSLQKKIDDLANIADGFDVRPFVEFSGSSVEFSPKRAAEMLDCMIGERGVKPHGFNERRFRVAFGLDTEEFILGSR
jgi:hypothetical protein